MYKQYFFSLGTLFLSDTSAESNSQLVHCDPKIQTLISLHSTVGKKEYF